MPGTVLKAWAKADDKDVKGNIFVICDCTVMLGGIVELGAPLRFSAVADGRHGGAGGECFGVENAALMKIKALV